MEKRYDPTYKDYQAAEFEHVGKLSRDGKQVIKEAETILRGRPTLPRRLARRAIEIFETCGPELAATMTLGVSRLAHPAPIKTPT